MTRRRSGPYIWVTWLSRLLVGDRSCEWSSWFKAHHRYYDRMPSDFDAFTSIFWRMARHGLEHLATTDRGVIMLRNQVRAGIQAVQEGKDPRELVRTNDVVRTYANDTVVRVPRASTEEADRQLVRETARRVAQNYIDNPPPLE